MFEVSDVRVPNCQLSLQFANISPMDSGPSPSQAATRADKRADSSSPESSSTGLGPALGERGSAISSDSTPPWPKRASANDDFLMGGCSGCVRQRPARRFRPSAASSASPGREPARSWGASGNAGYVTVADSATSKREKSVSVTSRGIDYLEVQRTKAKEIEDELKAALGEEGFSGLFALLDALGHGGSERMRTYLRRSVGRS